MLDQAQDTNLPGFEETGHSFSYSLTKYFEKVMAMKLEQFSQINMAESEVSVQNIEETITT